MNKYWPEIDTAYETGFTACAEPIWDIIESPSKNDTKVKLITQWIDRFYNHSIGTQVLGRDKEKIARVKKDLDKRYEQIVEKEIK